MKKVFIIAFSLLGVAMIPIGGWDYVEPLIGMATVGLAVATYLQTKKAEKVAYSDNGDGDWVVAFQVGRPVREAVLKQFGQCDALIDVQECIGSASIVLESHYKILASSVYKAVMAGQGKNVKLVMSGPVGLAVLIGQLIGLHHVNVTIYQFDIGSNGYLELPKANRDLL